MVLGVMEIGLLHNSEGVRGKEREIYIYKDREIGR